MTDHEHMSISKIAQYFYEKPRSLFSDPYNIQKGLYETKKQAKHFAEAQKAKEEEGRIFAEAQVEAVLSEKANKVYSKKQDIPKVKLPSQGRTTQSPPPHIDFKKFLEESEKHHAYMRYLQSLSQQPISPRPISPQPIFYYDNKGMLHIQYK